MLPRTLAGLALALLCASCVTYDYDRFRRYEESPPEAYAALVPGESDLTDVLDALGAPVSVWEPRPGSLALVWTWVDRTIWGFSASAPMSDVVDASFSWRDTNEDDEGLLLVFDEEWRLESIARGLVGEVLRDMRRPRLVE